MLAIRSIFVEDVGVRQQSSITIILYNSSTTYAYSRIIVFYCYIKTKRHTFSFFFNFIFYFYIYYSVLNDVVEKKK